MSVDVIRSTFVEFDLSELDVEGPIHVYVLFDGESIIYIGRTNSLKTRLRTHARGTSAKPKKQFTQAFAIQASPNEAALLENALIRRFNPPYCRAVHGDPSLDAEVLARFGMDVDADAHAAFVARRREAGLQMHRDMVIRAWSKRDRYARSRSLSAVLWKVAMRAEKRRAA